jgi:hypothetical protein
MITLIQDSNSHRLSWPSLDFPVDLLMPLRQWLNGINFSLNDRSFQDNYWLAQRICKLIPNHCPFERDICWFGSTYHIPALCQLNPLYTELQSLRWRALTVLVEVFGEDMA